MKKKEKSYKEAISEIETIITQLETGETDIDQITKEVKRACELINYCKNKLYATEEEINKVINDIEEE